MASQAADGDGTTENSKHEAERKRDPLVALLSHHKDEHNKSEKGKLRLISFNSNFLFWW